MEENIRRIQQQNEKNKGVLINREKVNAKKLMLMDMHRKREDKINTMDTLRDYDFNAKRLNHLGNYIELNNNRLDFYPDIDEDKDFNKKLDNSLFGDGNNEYDKKHKHHHPIV